MYGLAVMEPDGVRDVTVDYAAVVAQPHVSSMPSDGAWLTGAVVWPAKAQQPPVDADWRLLRVLCLAAFLLGAAVMALAAALAMVVR